MLTNWPHRSANTSAMVATRPYMASTTSNSRPAIASVRVSAKCGSAWMCSTSGSSGGSCTPRCSTVTSWPRSSSPVTTGTPLEPLPPMTRVFT